MWLYIDSPQHYLIENLCNCIGFLRGIQRILEPEDSLVFSSWGSPPGIRALLERHQLAPDEHVVQERRRLAGNDHYPDAFVVRWVAAPALLSQLADFLGTSFECSEFCDHIIAYGRRGALLSFHDAFQSDPLIVSGVIPESVIREFCEPFGVTYRLQDRKAFYDWSE